MKIQIERAVQRLLAVILAISMVFANTVSSYAAPPVGSYIKSSAAQSPIVSARFISPDTMDPTMPGVGTNRYAYADNDPINKSDPNGHWFGAAVGIAVGLLSSLFGGTKEANAPGANDKIENTSDAQQMLGMAAGAAGGTVAGKTAGEVAEGLFSKKKENQQQVVETQQNYEKAQMGVNTTGKEWSRTITANGDTYEISGVLSIEKNEVTISEFAIGKTTNDVSKNVSAIASVRTEIAREFGTMGFDKVTVQATRVSGANPRSYMEFTVDLTKYK